MGEHARQAGQTQEVQTSRGFLEASWVKTLTAGRHSSRAARRPGFLDLCRLLLPSLKIFPFHPQFQPLCSHLCDAVLISSPL